MTGQTPRVAERPPGTARCLRGFLPGESYDLTYDTPKAADLYTHDVDWVVTYIDQEQRGLVDPSVATQLGTPQCTVARDGVTLASVYAWPKPFAHTSDRPIGQGLRLLGWEVGDHMGAKARCRLPSTGTRRSWQPSMDSAW